jgi:YD repeat-containing protein
MKTKIFLLSAVVSWLLFNCSKNETGPSICYLSSFSGSYSGSYTYTNNKLAGSVEYGTTATYTYDSKGNIITINYSDGSIENYTYDANNRKLTITSPASYQLKYNYNSSGQLIRRDQLNYNSSTSSFELYSHLTFAYATASDKNWNRMQRFDAANTLIETYEYQYDNKHNPWTVVWGTSSIETDNNPTQWIYTQSGSSPVTTTITYTYTTNGYPLTSTTTVGSNSPTNATYTYSNCQ